MANETETATSGETQTTETVTKTAQTSATETVDTGNTDSGTTLTPHQQFLEMLPENLRSNPSFIKFDGKDTNEIISKMAGSYTNLEKLVGADKNAVLKIPASEEDKEGWSAIYEKIGRPETPDGYMDDKYKELPGFDENNFKEIAQAAYEKGAPKAAVDAIVSKFFEQQGVVMQQSEAQTEQTLAQYEESLKKEWGDAYDQKTAKVLGVLKEKADPEFLELAKDYPWIFDHPAVMKTMDNILKMSAEDNGVKTGGNSSAVMTPAEAKAQISAFNADSEKQKILMTPGHPMRETLLAEKSKLFKMANPS